MVTKRLNPVTYSLILLIVFQSVNDWFSINFGAPTPVQLILVGSILFNLQHSFKRIAKTKIEHFLIIYGLVVLVHTCLADLDGGGISILINLTWLISSIPLLSAGFNANDWKYLKRTIFLTVTLITIPSGFYELYNHAHILQTKYGLVEAVFYIRGLHIDKLEFGTFLAIGIFLSFNSLFISAEKLSLKSYLALLIIFCSAVVLILSSFSMTSIIGVGIGIISLLLVAKRYVMLLLVTSVAVPILVFQIQKTDIYKEQQRAYELKYDQSVTNIDESNFRYLSFNVAIDAFFEKPIFGYGIGESGEVVRKRLKLSKNINPHNIIANELLDFGLIGMIPLVLILIKVFKASVLRIEPNKGRQIGFLIEMRNVLTGLTFFMFTRLILYYHRFDQTFYLIWVALAVVIYSTYKNFLYYENFGVRQKIG